MRLPVQIGFGVMLALAPLLAEKPVRELREPKAPPVRTPSEKANKQPKMREAKSREPKQPPAPRLNPVTAIDRWNQMTPEQREKQLQKLPPERQAQIRERVQKWNQEFSRMTPAQQQRVRDMYQNFSKLTPQQQNAIRHKLSENLHQMNQLPEDRRRVVRRELDALRNMEPGERASRFSSEDFKGKFSANEQQILGNLSAIQIAPQ